jgi:hypothetical protein
MEHEPRTSNLNTTKPQKKTLVTFKSFTICMIVLLILGAIYAGFSTVDGVPQTATKKHLKEESLLSEAFVAKPLFGRTHNGSDGIFALAAGYDLISFQRFIGSLKKCGYSEDIVLGVSPRSAMKVGVEDYLRLTNVIAYEFDVECQSHGVCKFDKKFLGVADRKPYRTFDNLRYELYHYWLQYYHSNSMILVIDFRDVFFQSNPFASWGVYSARTKLPYELQLFAENPIFNIGNCSFNGNWISTCFGKDALKALNSSPIICSGSTLGSYNGMRQYLRVMLLSMSKHYGNCLMHGSDQGHHNYLYYNGGFNSDLGNPVVFPQGRGIVNTIGSMVNVNPRNESGERYCHTAIEF